MVDVLIVVGVLVAVFVGYNIGGSSTGVAFGPAVGSRIVRKVTAAALFSLFAFVGAWTVGRNVITTMSSQIVDAAVFSPEASVGVLFFTGLSLLISNVYGVPASTSMTAVGAIVGLGLATGTLNAALMFTILSAWIVAPLLAFFTGVVVGRYLYPYLDAWFSFGRLQNPLVGVDTDGRVPRPTLNENAAPRDLAGSALVVVIACYMGFSAGASNAANAVAPLVGNGSVTPDAGILLAVGSISLGGFTIARRTLATVGATIITVLSWLGIPASLAVSTTCCIIGLGWGRASRVKTLAEIATPPVADDPIPDITTGALAAPSTTDPEASSPTVGELAASEAPEPEAQRAAGGDVAPIGEEPPVELTAESLFDPAATARIVVLWVLTPTLSVVGAFLLFSLVG